MIQLINNCAQQIEIEGVGQQLATLATWKKENLIFTRLGNFGEWTCWDEIECPIEFLNRYGGEAIACAATEKEAIRKFCHEEGVELPFWW